VDALGVDDAVQGERLASRCSRSGCVLPDEDMGGTDGGVGIRGACLLVCGLGAIGDATEAAISAGFES